MSNDMIHLSSLYKSVEGKKIVLEKYENLLSHWPVPYKTHLIPTQFGDTFVIDCGDPILPPLLLLHGASSNALSWMGDIVILSQYFRVLAIDVIGEPGKSAETRPLFQGTGYADWLLEVLKNLAIEKVSIVGLSQGGWIALKFAVTFPDRIQKLVLLTPAGIIPTKASFMLRAILYTFLGKKGAEKLNRYVFGKQSIDPTALEFMNLIMTHFKSRLDKEYIFTDDELSRLNMPMLLVGGTEDVIRSVSAIAERLKKLTKNTQVLMIPDMGHVLVGITSQIISFLQ